MIEQLDAGSEQRLYEFEIIAFDVTLPPDSVQEPTNWSPDSLLNGELPAGKIVERQS
ncbi:MAG: hypothetical protein R3B90_14625 [Planctomycetaceae bacterium]